MENLIKVREVRSKSGGSCPEGFEGTFSARKLPPAPAWLIPFCLCPSYWPRNFYLGENSARSWKWSSHIHVPLRQNNQMHDSVKKQKIPVLFYHSSGYTDFVCVICWTHLQQFWVCVCQPWFLPFAEDAQASVLWHSCRELKECLGLQVRATGKMFSDTIRGPRCCDLRQRSVITAWSNCICQILRQQFAQGWWVIFPYFVCCYRKGTLGTSFET